MPDSISGDVVEQDELRYVLRLYVTGMHSWSFSTLR